MSDSYVDITVYPFERPWSNSAFAKEVILLLYKMVFHYVVAFIIWTQICMWCVHWQGWIVFYVDTYHGVVRRRRRRNSRQTYLSGGKFNMEKLNHSTYKFMLYEIIKVISTNIIIIMKGDTYDNNNQQRFMVSYRERGDRWQSG